MPAFHVYSYSKVYLTTTSHVVVFGTRLNASCTQFLLPKLVLGDSAVIVTNAMGAWDTPHRMDH
jgi:hypothetical protein